MQENAHERPDPGREIDLAVGDRGALRVPARTNQAFVAEDLAVGRSAPELPQQRAVIVEAIEIAVVRNNVMRPAAMAGAKRTGPSVLKCHFSSPVSGS